MLGGQKDWRVSVQWGGSQGLRDMRCKGLRHGLARPADIFPQPDLTDDGLARPVLAGIVATICFLAAAILFSTLAACFVNKQRKRKLKRKKGGCLLALLLFHPT